MKRAFVQTRLQSVLGEASKLSLKEHTFHFNNGVDPDPDFSGEIEARLLLHDQKLILESRPLSQKEPLRKEVLFDHVRSFEIKEIGSMLRLTVERKQEELRFAFVLLAIEPIPTYL